jgi:hypothetical protein
LETTGIIASIAGLFAALAGIPHLPRAACRGQSELFDGRTEDDVDDATTLCETACPELARCEAWAQSMPDNQLAGVVAGRMYDWVSHPSQRRKRAS